MLRKRYKLRKPRLARRRRLTVRDQAGASESTPFYARTQAPGSTTRNFVSGGKGTVFNVYSSADFGLNDLFRSVAIASQYQFFKIAYLELSILPDADTFAPGGPSGKPYLYYMIDKGNNINVGATNEQLKDMGAKAIALDEKPITIRWRPSVLLSTQINTATGTTSAGMYKTTPWLNTDANPNGIGFQPSQVCHYGLKFFVENNGAPVNYSGTLTAHLLFKKPLSTVSQIPLDVSGNNAINP